MEFNYLKLAKENKIALVTIKRPEALNALNIKVIKEIIDMLNLLKEDKEVRVIIFTGTGKSFIAGADIGAMSDMTPEDSKKFAELGLSMTILMEKLEKPIIAAVNGYALGGGTEFILSCDLVYASTNAVFGQPEVNLGIIPGFGGTQRLPRLVGKMLGKEIIFTGAYIKPERAYEMGLINGVFEPEKLIEETMKVASKIVAKGPLAIAKAKKAINEGYDLVLEKGLEMEKFAFSELFYTKDRYEGMKAFMEKRKPVFKGE